MYFPITTYIHKSVLWGKVHAASNVAPNLSFYTLIGLKKHIQIAKEKNKLHN